MVLVTGQRYYVINHASFEDDETAVFMNEHFINT